MRTTNDRLIAKTYRVQRAFSAAAEAYAAQNEMTPSGVVRLAMRRFLEAEGLNPITPLGVAIGRGKTLESPERDPSSLAGLPHGAHRIYR